MTEQSKSTESNERTQPAKPQATDGGMASDADKSGLEPQKQEPAGSSGGADKRRRGTAENARSRSGSSEFIGGEGRRRAQGAGVDLVSSTDGSDSSPSKPASSGAPETNGSSLSMAGFAKIWVHVFRSRAAIVVLGFVVGALFIVLTMQKIRWSDVFQAFQSGHWLPWLPLAVGTYVIGMLLRGYRLRLLVEGEAFVSVGTASNIVAVGYATNNILPARLGEFARAAILAERTGLPYLLSLTVTFLERLLDGLVILFLFAASSLMVPVDNTMRQYTGFAAIIFAAAMLLVALITLMPQTTVAIVSNLTSPLSRKWHSKAVALVTQVNRGFGCLRNARSALLILFSSFLVWLVESAFFMLVMPCFGLPPGFLRSVITMSVTNLGILLPSTPGYVGVYDYICMETLMSVCSVSGVTPGTVDAIIVDRSTALSYAVVVHLVFYATVTVWGVLALAKYSLEMGTTAALAWEAKPIKRLPEAENARTHEDQIWRSQPLSIITSYPELSPKVVESVTKFWFGLCECFIPEEHILKDKEAFQRVLKEASIFTVTELERLPLRLRVLFDIAVLAFKALIVAGTGRFLCRIPLPERRRIVRAWAFGGFSLTRKFMKPIRSLALFAYYESPEVQTLLDETAKAQSLAPDTALAELQYPNPAIKGQKKTADQAVNDVPKEAENQPPREAKNDVPRKAESEPPHEAENDVPKEAENKPAYQAKNDVPRKAESEPPHEAENDVPKEAENEPPHEAENDVPKEAENEPPHEAENDVPKEAEKKVRRETEAQ